MSALYLVVVFFLISVWAALTTQAFREGKTRHVVLGIVVGIMMILVMSAFLEDLCLP